MMRLRSMQRTRVGHLPLRHSAFSLSAPYVAGNVVINHSTCFWLRHESNSISWTLIRDMVLSPRLLSPSPHLARAVFTVLKTRERLVCALASLLLILHAVRAHRGRGRDRYGLQFGFARGLALAPADLLLNVLHRPEHGVRPEDDRDYRRRSGEPAVLELLRLDASESVQEVRDRDRSAE